jgi:hypothetical protein
MLITRKNLPEPDEEPIDINDYLTYYDFGDYGIGFNSKNKMFYVKYDYNKTRQSKYFKTSLEALYKLIWFIQCDEEEIIYNLRMDGVID